MAHRWLAHWRLGREALGGGASETQQEALLEEGLPAAQALGSPGLMLAIKQIPVQWQRQRQAEIGMGVHH